MKTKIIKISAITVSVFLLAAPIFVFAQIKNPLGDDNTDIGKFIPIVLGYIVKIGGIIATLAFIWAGFLYVKAQGAPAELTKAKDVFINTCIGTALLIGAQLIATIISGTINSLKS